MIQVCNHQGEHTLPWFLPSLHWPYMCAHWTWSPPLPLRSCSIFNFMYVCWRVSQRRRCCRQMKEGDGQVDRESNERQQKEGRFWRERTREYKFIDRFGGKKMDTGAWISRVLIVYLFVWLRRPRLHLGGRFLIHLKNRLASALRLLCSHLEVSTAFKTKIHARHFSHFAALTPSQETQHWPIFQVYETHFHNPRFPVSSCF